MAHLPKLTQWSWPPSYYVDCKLYLDLTSFSLVSFLFQCPIWDPMLHLVVATPSLPLVCLFLNPSLPFQMLLKSVGPIVWNVTVWVSLILFLDYTEVMDLLEPEWGTLLVVLYWGTYNEHTTGDANLDHWVKVLSARFLHCEVTIFLFVVNIYFEIGTLRVCANLRGLWDHPHFWYQAASSRFSKTSLKFNNFLEGLRTQGYGLLQWKDTE